MEAAMRSLWGGAALGLALLGWAAAAEADSRTEKFRRGDCEVERKYGDRGEFDEKIDCRPGRHRGPYYDGDRRRVGKEKFRQGRCKVKREWKEDGVYNEEINCK
jgi:hypothetical protein